MQNLDNTGGQRLKHKSALITGASRGIGYAIAKSFASQGANLVLSAFNEAGLVKVKAELDIYGVDISYMAADISSPNSIEALFAFAVDCHPDLDVLVNNAGIHIAKPFTDHGIDEFDHLMKTNVYSVFQLTQHAIRHMQKLGRGKVVNVASIAGLRASMNSAAYNTSKHAVVGLTRCVALENAKNGINVNAICPGVVETDLIKGVEQRMDAAGMPPEEFRQRIISQIPIGRMLRPDEVANIALFLASSESDGMSGETITI
jgi:NAD(P)-dependent dehydrogenase (short-subunit alcohol dehydrogenase family)